jgi:hypothetical protein
MNPVSLMHLQMLLLPSPRSHWSATGPRSKTQQSNTRNTQRKTTRALAARVKLVRPVSKTGHTGFARLSQPPTHQNQSKRTRTLAKLGPELLLPKEDLFQEDLLQTTPLTKPVRPVLQTGHIGFAQKTPKSNKAKNQANELQTRRNLDQGTS